MDLDQLIRDADPAQGLDINVPDPASITRQEHAVDHRAAAGGVDHRPTATRTRRVSGRLAMAFSAFVVIAVAATVLAVGRHPHSPASSGSTQPRHHRASSSGLAIFRRAQTPKDRTMPALVYRAAKLGGLPKDFATTALAGTIPSKTRYLETLPDGREAFLTQVRASVTYRSHGRQRPDARARVFRLIIVQPDGKWTHGQPIISPGGMVPSNRIARIEALFGGGCALNTLFSVMPNGVTRVRWQFPRQDHYGYVYKAPLTLNIPVRGNYAIATIPGRASCDRPSVITLYDRDGNVIAHKGNPANLGRITRPVRHGDPTAGISGLEHHP
jgi:hypothetical protein